jgi:hypothetical protein
MIENERAKFHRVIAKHYGAGHVDEVLSMLQVGSEAYHTEVMRAHRKFRNYVNKNIRTLYPNMKLKIQGV